MVTTTLFEASNRLGGKLQSRRFDSAPVTYEAGVAECYDYETLGPDPLRQLIGDLGLTTVPTHGTAVVLNGTIAEGRQSTSARTSEAALSERSRTSEATLPPCCRSPTGIAASSRRTTSIRGRAAPARRRARRRDDPVARKYLKIGAHSDMATEPHLVNGLIGLRNFLKSVPGYGAQYSIEGGMERLARAAGGQADVHPTRARGRRHGALADS